MLLRVPSSITVSIELTNRTYGFSTVAAPSTALSISRPSVVTFVGISTLRLCRPPELQRQYAAKTRPNGRVGMPPNAADTFSSSVFVIDTREVCLVTDTDANLRVPRIVSDETFQISLRHAYFFSGLGEVLSDEK